MSELQISNGLLEYFDDPYKDCINIETFSTNEAIIDNYRK